MSLMSHHVVGLSYCPTGAIALQFQWPTRARIHNACAMFGEGCVEWDTVHDICPGGSVCECL